MKRSIAVAIAFAVGLVGAAALKVIPREAPLCAEGSRGHSGLYAGDNVNGSTTRTDAVVAFVEMQLGQPDIMSNERVVIAIDDDRNATTISEDGVIVASFSVEVTDLGGFIVVGGEYCTDGVSGPYLAETFDPSGAFDGSGPEGTGRTTFATHRSYVGIGRQVDVRQV